jgi:hypothetical protein
MSDIKISNSQIFTWDTDINSTEYRIQSVTGLNFIPDIAILRQISYIDVSPETNFGQYFIWCSLTNNYIGSFYVATQLHSDPVDLGQSMFVSNPQSVITSGVNNISGGVSFRIDILNNGVYSSASTLNGVINIQIDFLKFKDRS